MEMHELKDKTEAELHALLAEAREDRRAMRFQAANLSLKNIRAARVRRKDAARILTALNQKRKESQ